VTSIAHPRAANQETKTPVRLYNFTPNQLRLLSHVVIKGPGQSPSMGHA
jgi:hypothetical protein